MKVGDMFYSVNNRAFKKPRITKFKVKKIDYDYPYPIVSTKQDKWGRYYRFKESQIHLTYKDALIEKNKIIEKIKSLETEKAERDRAYFEEQKRKEKQRQIDHDKQVRKEVCNEIYDLLTTGTIWRLMKTTWSFTNDECEELRKLLDQIQGE